MTTMHRANFNALRALLARVEAVPRLSTLDLDHWQLVALDIETYAVVDGLPTIVADSPEACASMYLATLHESGVAAVLDATPATLRTLAEAFPRGITWHLGDEAAELDDTSDAHAEVA